MKNYKRSLKYKIRYCFAFVVIICWCAALTQTVYKEYGTHQSVPAFQNHTIAQDVTQDAFQNLSDSGQSNTQDAFQNLSGSGQSNTQDAFQSLSDSGQSNTLWTPPDADIIWQTDQSQTWEIAEFPDSLTRDSALSYCQTLAASFDYPNSTCDSASGSAILLSSGHSSGYSDFYFYSPSLTERFSLTPLSSSQGNLQIAFTWNPDGSCSHVYLGFPIIEYCF